MSLLQHRTVIKAAQDPYLGHHISDPRKPQQPVVHRTIELLGIVIARNTLSGYARAIVVERDS